MFITNLSNFQNIQLESDICVITLDDNLRHTYCSKIKWEKDNRAPIGVAQLTMPYDEQIAQYWIKYSGTVIVHANLNAKEDMIKNMTIGSIDAPSLNLKKIQETAKNQEIEFTKSKNNKIRLVNDIYNYTFIGKVHRFKQVGKTFIVYLEDLGWKFLQKVPKEFRNSFIAGQSLDNAFQAICEFMGVEFAYSIEDLSQYKFSADGYSVEKDGKIIENVPSILSEWKPTEEEDNEDTKTKDEQMAKTLAKSEFESDALIDYEKNNSSKGSLNNSSSVQTTGTINEATNTQEQQTSIKKMLRYQEEFDEKIKDLFIGNTLYDSNVSDPILNYNWITITPQAVTTTSSTASTTTSSTAQSANQLVDEISKKENNQTTNEAIK